MFKYKEITIFNFKNFYKEPFVYKFDNSSVTFIDQNNGFGKTTILDAIAFLFTGKMLNGSTMGWESLDEDNKPMNLKPSITLKVEHNDLEHTLTLFNGRRSANGIVFTTNKLFSDWLLTQFDLDVNKFQWHSNPFHILDVLPQKETRLIFLNLFLNNPTFKKEVQTNFEKEACDFDPKKVFEIVEKRKMFSVQDLIKSYRNEVKNLTAQYNSQIEVRKLIDDSITLTKEEIAQYDALKCVYEAISNLDSNIKRIKANIFDANERKCFFCKQTISNPDLIADNQKNINKVQELEEQKLLLQQKFDEQTFMTLKNKLAQKQENKLYEDLDVKINDTLQKIEAFNQLLSLSVLFERIEIECLNQHIKSSFPFTLKLFHKNKSTDGYVETFSLLENGVDYRYLNYANKFIIGAKLISYLEKEGAEKEFFPLLVDNGESIDDRNLKVLLETTKHKQVIIARVDRSTK